MAGAERHLPATVAKTFRQRLVRELLSWVWVALAFFLITGTMVQARVIPSASMEGTLLIGDNGFPIKSDDQMARMTAQPGKHLLPERYSNVQNTPLKMHVPPPDGKADLAAQRCGERHLWPLRNRRRGLGRERQRGSAVGGHDAGIR